MSNTNNTGVWTLRIVLAIGIIVLAILDKAIAAGGLGIILFYSFVFL